MVYVDTSVLVAYYCPERISRRAQAALVRDGAPCVSLLAEVEFLSALARKTRTGEMQRSAAVEVAARFREHVADGLYRMVPLEAPEFVRASQWLGRMTTALRTLDALHLAAAHAARLAVLTADLKMARAASKVGVPHTLLK